MKKKKMKMEDIEKENEFYVLGFKNEKEYNQKYFEKMFESYGYSTESIKIIYQGSILNLRVDFKKKLSNVNSIELSGIGEFEITKSKERMKEFTQEKEKDVSFPFIK
jgi:nucleoid DNA-binding protein